MKIKKMASCTGESMASNRKNKLICYWDYELELKWECVKKINANDKITGIYFATVLKWVRPPDGRRFNAATCRTRAK